MSNPVGVDRDGVANPLADTKEKPFICFCGAAFTRRDLLKRHTRISHEDGVVSPDEPAMATAKGPSLQPPPPAPAPIGYDASARPVASIPESSAVHWPAAQPESAPPYLPPIHAPGIMPAAPPNPNPAADVQPGVHDPAMLQAAQLLLPSDYEAPRQ